MFIISVPTYMFASKFSVEANLSLLIMPVT